MRTLNLLRSLCIVSALACGIAAHAQLPDLRGKTLFLTGTLHAQGSVSIAFQTYNFNEDLPITAANPARLVIDNSGPADNSALTGSLPLPPVVTDPYPVCGNPTLPFTASFNRTTGVLTATASLPGDSTLDFGAQEVDPLGTNRIMVRMRDLTITVTVTGTIESDGTLRFRQPGDNPFSYAIVSGTSGRPRLALVDPDSCTFGGVLQANVTNSSIILRNWVAELPSISGTVTLEDCPNPNVPMTFILRPSDNSGDITRTITPNANGTFVIPNLPAKSFAVRVKSSNTLAKIVSADTTLGSVTDLPVGALKGGDANNDNIVALEDLAALIESFDADPGSPNWLDGVADFNCDGIISIDDLHILIRNFDASGADF